MEGMLPAPLADNSQQYQLAWMHMGIAVIGLVRILRSIVWVHVIRHGTSVNHVISGMIILGSDVHASGASGAPLARLLFRLLVDLRIHLGELEEIFPVVAGRSMVIRRRRQPVIGLTVEQFGSDRSASGGRR